LFFSLWPVLFCFLLLCAIAPAPLDGKADDGLPA
jgi:hypothetical protein